MKASARTQSSIAISSNGEDWLLINASPDVGTQIRQLAALHPRREQGLRHTPISAVLLMDSHIDHVTGLLSLREGKPLQLYCTASVHEDLTQGLPIINVLSHYCGVQHHALVLDGKDGKPFHIPKLEGLSFTALQLKGKAPPYSPHRAKPTPGDNIALLVRDDKTGAMLYYAPGLAVVEQAEKDAMNQATCVLVDGTFWTQDEMITAGLGKKKAADMGHLPQQTENPVKGMMDELADIKAKRKILIHINNSNPILNDAGAERAELSKRGIELAYDGMEITL